MARPDRLGGVIHTYQKYDPQNIPSPNQPPPDLVSPAFEHLLAYGSLREFTDEELASAVRLDISRIAGLGPSLESLREMLEERKRKILEKYETRCVRQTVADNYRRAGAELRPPGRLAKLFERAFRDEQIRELEQLWYRAGDDRSDFARGLMPLIARLGEKYQIDELAARYAFTGRAPLTPPQALEVKEELETIDRLLKQLREATKTARLAIIDMSELAEMTDPESVEQLKQFQEQLETMLRQMAERQGLERGREGFRLTPHAYRVFQGRLLERIFSELQASRSGRHQGPVVGEGAVELPSTKPYEFGDSIANMDMPQSLINALVRSGPGLPVRLGQQDIVVHRTRNTPKCATVVVMDMSGSMRYDAQYIHVKRMALALDGLIRREYPGDYLRFLQMFSFARPVAPGDVASLMPNPPTVFDPIVRRKYDLSREDTSEAFIPKHFTNIQHALQLARQFLATQDTPNRQVILITDGLPTAHFEGPELFLLYPPDPRTEVATMREGQHCRREGVTINIFLLPSWSQSREDVQFAQRLAQGTQGRVFFAGGRDLDRFVLWDYVRRRREIIA